MLTKLLNNPMNYLVRKLIKRIVFIVLVLCAGRVNAQISSIKNAIDKIESNKNFSYKTIIKQVGFTSDTLIMQQEDIFLKAPEDKTWGYLFNIKTVIKADKTNFAEIYDGQNIIHIDPRDSTYEIKQIRANFLIGSLLERLKSMRDQLEKKPGKFGADTLINGVTNSHLIVNASQNLFIDKSSGLPTALIEKWSNGSTNFYIENRYFDYKLNQDDIDKAVMTIPKGFHPPKRQPAAPPLLAPGTIAPDWTLYTAGGKKMSLSQMKGKVVLLDFYFIGCIPSMQAIKPLNKLYEKYKNQNLIMASVTERNKEKTVLTFDKQYGIKYLSFVNAANVVKSYNVSEFPTFYFIDKEGKIADVIPGYNEDFEEKATLIINKLFTNNK